MKNKFEAAGYWIVRITQVITLGYILFMGFCAPQEVFHQFGSKMLFALGWVAVSSIGAYALFTSKQSRVSFLLTTLIAGIMVRITAAQWGLFQENEYLSFLEINGFNDKLWLSLNTFVVCAVVVYQIYVQKRKR